MTLRAISYRRSRSTGSPARSTGSSMRVRRVTAASIRAGSMLRVTGSISTNTGRGAGAHDHVGGANPGERRGDDFIPGPDAGQRQCDFHGTGS